METANLFVVFFNIAEVFSHYIMNNNYISLKKTSDFKNTYNEKKSKANNLLVGYIRKNDLTYNRYGISVSKKVGNSVIRHRLKRQVREVIRLNNDNIIKGYDIIFIVRVNARGKDYESIFKAVINIINRQGLWLKK